jgi:hypothetical protein
MNGFRFYLEYPNKTEKNKATVKNLGKHSGNVIAVFVGQWIPNSTCIEAVTSLYEYADSPVCCSSVSMEYLREKCKRIPERMVKLIHPKLHNYLIQ